MKVRFRFAGSFPVDMGTLERIVDSVIQEAATSRGQRMELLDKLLHLSIVNPEGVWILKALPLTDDPTEMEARVYLIGDEGVLIWFEPVGVPHLAAKVWERLAP